MFEATPYYHRGPIHQPRYFYGRREEVQRVFYLLQQGQSVSLTGPRKIGKTSLLFYVRHPEVTGSRPLPGKPLLFVYVDCSSLQDATPGACYRYLAEEMSRERGKPAVDGAGAAGEIDFLAFERLVQGVVRERRPVFLLDEFEGLGRNRLLDAHFFAGLRALAIKYQVVFVTASKIGLEGMPTAVPGTLLSSNFFNIFTRIHLPLFDEASSRQLVEGLLAETDVPFSPRTIEWILDMGGGHPFFLQIAGDCAFERSLRKGKTLDEADYRAIHTCLEKEAFAHLHYYWSELDETARYLLTMLPVLSNTTPYRHILRELDEAHLISRSEQGNYHYFSPLLAEFVALQKVGKVVKAGPLLIDQRQQAVFLRGTWLELTELTYHLLVYLVEREGETVGREALDVHVWQSAEATGSEEHVKAGIKALRQALGDDKGMIVSRWGKGYTFVPYPLKANGSR